jgi:hypothetical protein
MLLVPALACASPHEARHVVLKGTHDVELKPGESFDKDYVCYVSEVGKGPKLTLIHASGYPLRLQIKRIGSFGPDEINAYHDGDFVKYRGVPMDATYRFSVWNEPSTRPKTIKATVEAICNS